MKKILRAALISVITLAACLSLSACFSFVSKPDNRDKIHTPVNIEIEVAATSVTFIDNEHEEELGHWLEFSINGIDWDYDATITGLTPATEYTAYARYMETDEYKASDSFTKRITTLKENQVAPSVTFAVADKTVTVEQNSSLEYSYDGGVTFTDRNVFTFAETGDKDVRVRYKETTDKYFGEEQRLKVHVSDFYSGIGSETDPYIIRTEEHFLALKGNSRQKFYKLAADITFTRQLNQSPSLFMDVFDGDGHKLINPKVSVDGNDRSDCGIFGRIGTVKNLIVENAEIRFVPADDASEYSVGILTGTGQIIENCKASGSIEISDSSAVRRNSYIGGLVGEMNKGLSDADGFGIESSQADVRISYSSSENTNVDLSIGGLYGGEYNYSGILKVSRSRAKAEIEAFGLYGGSIGGLAGFIQGEIAYCYAEGSITTDGIGDVDSRIDLGGLAGKFNGSVLESFAAMNIGADGTAQNVYAGGIAGVIIGFSSNSEARDCFFAGNISVTTGDGYTAHAGTFYAKDVSTTVLIVNCYHSDNLVSPVVTDKTTAVSAKTMKTVTWQRDTLKFNAEAWNFAEGSYPSLK